MLEIKSGHDRVANMAKHPTTIALLGPAGAGKTHSARTLDPDSTLFVDLEAGTLSLGDWPGDVLDVRAEAAKLGVHPWELCRALACWLTGPDPAVSADNPYSLANYEQYKAALGDPANLAKYETVFVDSITVASRHCFSWCEQQPENLSERTGTLDTRSVYGHVGRELIQWLTTLQHMPRSIVIACILDQEEDDFKRVTYKPQIVGGQAARALPGIFDNVVTLNVFAAEDGTQYRAFCCQTLNEWGFPAKNRSNHLDVLEPPDLGQLIQKIRGQAVSGVSEMTPAVAPQPQTETTEEVQE